MVRGIGASPGGMIGAHVEIYLENKAEKKKWMNERMEKGYSFVYKKGTIYGEKINVAVKCVETGDVLLLKWTI